MIAFSSIKLTGNKENIIMQPSQNSFSLHLRKALVFLFILTISSCGGCKKEKGKGTPEKVFIMLIHGIADQRGGVSNLTYVIDPLRKALEGDQAKNKNKRDIDIFAPARKNSVTASIKEQAEDMFKLIQSKGITPNDKLIIMAHSQGGLLAMALYAMFMRDWKNMAIVSVQGALQGTPAAQPNQTAFDQLIASIQNLIEGAKKLIEGDKIASLNVLVTSFGSLGGGSAQIRQQILNSFPNHQQVRDQIKYLLGWQDGQGGKDLVPNSSFIQELKLQMPNPVTIPMLLVAGRVQDFVGCISKAVFGGTKYRILQDIKKIAPQIAEFAEPVLDNIIGGIVQHPTVKSAMEGDLKIRWNSLISNGTPNDLVIPVDSQLGEQLVQGDKVKKKTYSNYTHIHGLLSPPIFDEEVKFMKDFINASDFQ